MASAEERNAVVRAILTALAVATLAMIGAGTVVNNYVVEPMRSDIETLKRSNAAHFGQIKKTLKEIQDAQ